jgi:hypothetical protein
MARTSQIRFGSIGKENNLGKVKINAAKDIMAFDYLDWDHDQTEYLAVPLPADDNKMAFGGGTNDVCCYKITHTLSNLTVAFNMTRHVRSAHFFPSKSIKLDPDLLKKT